MREMSGYDVIVCGGGAGGFSAAVAASREGARTLLLEREGCLGGGATTMLVHPFMSHLTRAEGTDALGTPVNAGVFAEVVEQLERRGAADSSQRCIRFDDEVMKLVLDEITGEAGVDVIFHAALFDAETSDGRIAAARFAHNGGPIRAGSKVFIDATGDALLAAAVGCDCMFGNADGAVMPMTLNFIVGGVDTAAFPPTSELRKLARSGASEDPPLVNTNVSCVTIPREGFVHFNAIRVPGNALDASDLSRCEIESRGRVENFVGWLRRCVPGCKKCYLIKTGVHVGIRESRRVVGDYMLTGSDFKRAAKFDDGIACCSYDIDIHTAEQGRTRIERMSPGEYYQIPYRCLTPKGVENLLIAGRAISADIEAHSSLRIMPTVMCIGQAAGIAAALSLPGGNVREVDVQEFRRKIRTAGGVLEPHPPKE